MGFMDGPEFRKLTEGKTVVLATDPPFNIGYAYKGYSDRKPKSEYWDWIAGIAKRFPHSVIIHYPEAICELSIRLGKAPERIAAWVYNSNTARQHRDIAYFGVKPDFRKVRQPYKNQSDRRIRERIARGITGGRLYDWWEINQVKNVSKGKNGFTHPCVMPEKAMENAIGILPFPKESMVVFDPFMGTGTTGVACAKLGIDFIGCEMEPTYFEEAERRLAGL